MIIIFHDFSSLSPTAQSILGDWSASLSIAADKRCMPEQARTIAENCHAADSAANADASHALVRPVLN